MLRLLIVGLTDVKIAGDAAQGQSKHGDAQLLVDKRQQIARRSFIALLRLGNLGRIFTKLAPRIYLRLSTKDAEGCARSYLQVF